MRRVFVLLCLVLAGGLVGGAGSASAATEALGVPCVEVADGSFQCGSTSPRSTVKTWDGMPIDINVALPDPDTFGAGPYPMVMNFHGYGESKVKFSAMERFTDEGYAVFSMTDRGFFESCGSQASVDADPAGCAGQYVRLMDARYEVRDAQYFAGRLADENLALPTKIAALGNSYGGATAMALAVLKNRTMLPDGRLIAWTSPGGKPMSLAAAVPFATWSDLAYSLAPNGRMLDYLRDNPFDVSHPGVMKQSITNGLYMTGTAVGRYAPKGELPAADLAGWIDLLNQGEPYLGNPGIDSMIAEISKYHSSYYFDHSQDPAPLLIGAGFTDDIFPVDEALRFYNRTRAERPNTPIALTFGDFGHQRAQNKSADLAAWGTQQLNWINWHVLHKAPKQNNEVTVYTESCPSSSPSAGPITAKDWASFVAGEVVVEGGSVDQVIKTWGGSKDVAIDFGVLKNDACASPAGAKEPGTANYETAPVPAAGFTMLGSPTVIADFRGAGTGSQIAARLVDVAPDGTKQLVARQLYRADHDGYQVFQLHPGAWNFAAGHIARLELLPKDASSSAAGGTLANYGRPSNQQQEITVKDLVLRLPVVEAPGSLGGLVKAVGPKVMPDDRGPVALASGFLGSVTMKEWAAERSGGGAKARLRVTGPVKAKGRVARVRLTCQAQAGTCARTRIVIDAHIRGRKVVLAKGSTPRVAPGKSRILTLKLTRQARMLIGGRKVVRKQRGRRVVKHTRGLKRLKVKVTLFKVGSRKVTSLTLKRSGRVR